MGTKLRVTSKMATTTLAFAALMAMGSVGANASTLTPPETNAANTIAPGGTGDVGATIWNQIGTAATGTVTLFLTAPSHSTFTSTQVWGTNINQGVESAGSSPVLTNCTLSNGNTQMTCTGALTIPAAGNGKLSGLKFTTPVAVDSSAPGSTTFTDGVFNMTNSNSNSSPSGNDISGGRTGMQYVTPAVVETPMVDPLVGLGGGTLALGAGIGVALNRRRRVGALAGTNS